MIPVNFNTAYPGDDIPRASGDDPLMIKGINLFIKYSPRERG